LNKDQPEEVRKYDFSVEQHKNVFFFSFDRIAVPYCLSSNIDTNYFKGPSGITIYDFEVKPVWKIAFEQDFTANVLDMIDN